MITLARRVGDRPKEAKHLSWLALTLSTTGQPSEAEQAVDAALEALEGIPEGPAHASVYCQLAELRMTNRNLAEAVVWGERAIALADRLGDVQTLILGLNALGGARLAGGDVERGRAELERSLHLARQAGDDGLVAGALADLGSDHGEAFQFAVAERYLTEAITTTTSGCSTSGVIGPSLGSP
jgi:tetratricopeptide (TPR) repeat protein